MTPIGFRRGHRGFTLVELLVVIGIATLLLTLSATSFFGATRGEALNKSRDQLRDVLLSARQQACILGKTHVVLCWNVDTEVEVGSKTQKGKQGRYATFQYVGRVWPQGNKLAAPFGIQRDLLSSLHVNERLINIDDPDDNKFMRVKNVPNDDTKTIDDNASDNSGNRINNLDYDYYDGEKLRLVASDVKDYYGHQNLGFFVAELRESSGETKPFPLGLRVTSTYSLPRLYSFDKDRTAFVFTPDGRVEQSGSVRASLALAANAPAFTINVSADGDVESTTQK